MGAVTATMFTSAYGHLLSGLLCGMVLDSPFTCFEDLAFRLVSNGSIKVISPFKDNERRVVPITPECSLGFDTCWTLSTLHQVPQFASRQVLNLIRSEVRKK